MTAALNLAERILAAVGKCEARAREADDEAALRRCEADRDLVGSAKCALEYVDDNGRYKARAGMHYDDSAMGEVEIAAGVWLLALEHLANGYGIDADDG